MDKKIFFAVPKGQHRMDRSDMYVLIGYIQKNSKNFVDFRCTTGVRKGSRIHMNKSDWVLFGNLRGARAHLKFCCKEQIERAIEDVALWHEKMREFEICLDHEQHLSVPG